MIDDGSSYGKGEEKKQTHNSDPVVGLVAESTGVSYSARHTHESVSTEATRLLEGKTKAEVAITKEGLEQIEHRSSPSFCTSIQQEESKNRMYVQAQTDNRSVKHLVKLEADTHSLFFVENNRRLRLTKKEYRIFQVFFQKGLLSDEHLAREIFVCSDDKSVRECLEKHIDHLRAKIRVYGWDIYRVLRYGYILLPFQLGCEL